jgi:glycine hydroxymethyltransferase
MKNFLRDTVEVVDPQVAALMDKEEIRQASNIRLIPSENYASTAVIAATASAFGNKYSEGYPHKWKQGQLVVENGRYYNGQQYSNSLENLAIERCLQLFAPRQESAYHANVQPLSGASANLAVLNAFLETGDTFLGLSLDYGGHLTHGHKVSVTSKFFRAVQYQLDSNDILDYDAIRNLAVEHMPKLIICGATAYPRTIDFAAFGEISREVGAILVADISHISGLVSTGNHPHPFPHADVITSTTHKVLRGPRGGLIICKKEYGQTIDRSVFPGLQGGPHMNTIAGIAVALKEALDPDYQQYAQQVVKNARHLAIYLLEHGFHLVSGGTDNHMVLIDVTKARNTLRAPNGAAIANAAERAGLIINKNTVPGDAKPWNPSGIRLGTPAVTTLGMQEPEMELVAAWLARVAENLNDDVVIAEIRSEVAALMQKFPAPTNDNRNI